MKTNLFYFSATGNSLRVAKDIAAKLPETQVISIPNVMNREVDLDADNIGIVFPVYFQGPPKIVADFISKLHSTKAQYVFAVCTCGAFPMGALLQAQRLLRSRGLDLNAGFSIPMPGSYLVKYGAYPAGKQKALFEREKKKVDAIVKMIENRQENKIEHNGFLMNAIGNLAYKSMLPKLQTLDRHFNVSEKCSGCRTCEKVCPVQNIKMAGGKPTWQGNCEHCLACMQWCPVEAIQYGTQTESRKRYHHPEILGKELYRENP